MTRWLGANRGLEASMRRCAANIEFQGKIQSRPYRKGYIETNRNGKSKRYPPSLHTFVHVSHALMRPAALQAPRLTTLDLPVLHHYRNPQGTSRQRLGVYQLGKRGSFPLPVKPSCGNNSASAPENVNLDHWIPNWSVSLVRRSDSPRLRSASEALAGASWTSRHLRLITNFKNWKL